jgi:hypothetical protein
MTKRFNIAAVCQAFPDFKNDKLKQEGTLVYREYGFN